MNNRTIKILGSFILLTFIILILSPGAAFAAKKQVAISKAQAEGKKFKNVIKGFTRFKGTPVHYVKVNPRGEKVKVTPAFCPGYSEIDRNYPSTTMKDVMKHYKPTAAINGTFFDAGSRRTVCNVVVNGKLVCEGDRGSTVYLDKENNPGIILTSRLRGRNIKWDEYQWAVQSGPTLLYEGKTIINPYAEGFRDTNLFRPARRTAIGITKSGKLIFAVSSGAITLTRMAAIMKHLGCVHAINLDGGSSSALTFEKKHEVKPARKLPNFILIYDDESTGNPPTYPAIKWLLWYRDRMIGKKNRKIADKLADKQNYGAAYKYYMRACRKLSFDAPTLLATARAFENGGKKQQASRFYGKSAMILLESGKNDDAVKYANKALTLNKKNNYAQEVLGILGKYPEYPLITKNLSVKDNSAAYKLTLELLAKNPDNPRFYTILARIFGRMERTDLKAHSYYLSALYFDSRKDRKFEAYLMAKNAVETDPSSSEYRLLLAKTAQKYGRKGAAKYHKFLASRLKGTDTKKRNIKGN